MGDKVLIVDDEIHVRETLKELLEGSGCEVLLAAGAEEAMDHVSREDLVAVFLDLKLFGMNGLDLCRKIRKLRPLTVIYAMTGWLGLFDVEECREVGFDDFFPKPLTQEVLIRAVKEACEKKKRWNRVHKNL
ncbi:MAG: response regulator [Syntrophales bacterium]|nr:response regulator [Syntrophales bacterium]